MLFDEKDLLIFDSKESRNYFKEILQSYYSGNYRATIVLLYSFVIYDLFLKLQHMSDEGDSKATQELKDINNMISDDEKYSKVENKIIEFFIQNSSLYFKRFAEDITYLKDCRNKCAHLKVDEATLYVPSDYHCRMLICSMYDNVLSVKAPFIMDLFDNAINEVEKLSSQYPYIIDEEVLEENIFSSIKNKYLSRMTDGSINKSFKTFAKLLFKSEDEECEKNASGLYIFLYSLIKYIIGEGYMDVFEDSNVVSLLSNISIESLGNNDLRRNALISLMLKFPIIMDIVRSNDKLFDYISNRVLNKSYGLKHYKLFYPRSLYSACDYFYKNIDDYRAIDTEDIYSAIKDSDDFDIDLFYETMVNKIPSFTGFSEADGYMDSLKKNIKKISNDSIERIMDIYNKNDQCYKRNRHNLDMEDLKDYIANLDDNHIND